jgi:hypothetical protein
VAEVEAGLATLKGTAQTLSHPEFTEEINEGDGMRDGGLGSLKINAIRSKDRKDPVWIQAGQRVLRAFNDFGNDMATRSIAEETSAVDNFLNAIDSTPELKSAIATIQGNIFVQDIRDGQQLVKQGIAKRDASNKTEELAAYEAARILGTSIDKLFRYVNMKLEFEPEPELAALASDINKVIARYRKNINLQATLRKEAKQEKKDNS